MEHFPDGKAYLVGHRAIDNNDAQRAANNSWNTEDSIFMSRVLPNIENMNDASKYEYFSGYNKQGEAVSSKDFKLIKPVFD